jgi:DNA-binding GntR family transcriptional regulator
MTEKALHSLRPAIRQTLGDNVADSLREAIFRGLFQPGQRLAEAPIASKLKVSRAPVRDALASLEQEGLVSRDSTRGATVISLSRKDVEEICSLRQALEILAVQRAIEVGTNDHWSRLAANIRETEKARTPEQLANLDLEFHDTLMRAAGHGRLLSTWMGLRSQIRLLMMRRNLGDADSLRGTVRGHKELLEAIQLRDLPRALEMVGLHHRRQYEWLITGFGEFEAGGSRANGDDLAPG